MRIRRGNAAGRRRIPAPKPHAMERMYQQALSAGRLLPDAAQLRLVGMLSQLQGKLPAFAASLEQHRAELSALQRQIQTVPSKDEGRLQQLHQKLEELRPPRKPKGIYIHGGVGTGKTQLMDLFFESTQLAKKRRVHLHDFMVDVHSRIHAWKQAEPEEEPLLDMKEEKEAEVRCSLRS
eukprot:scaffold31_cov263-Pinguiococcus_pyrenoidosus.AAC.46